MMDEKRQIAAAMKKLGFPPDRFDRCDERKAADVARLAKQRFVNGNPRVWWLGLKEPYEAHEYHDPNEWAKRLRDVVPRDTERCWLIVESDREAYTVYDVALDAVGQVLSECGFFEYYLVGPDFSWIVADADHNQLLVARPR
jgi:hypothetical protein